MNRITTKRHGLEIDAEFVAFVEDQVLEGTGISPDRFWQGHAALLDAFAEDNRALLDRRAKLQTRIDAWHKARG
ncbi:MAG: hypothetical protein ACU0DM_12765, partial [Paracoccus sp. (in: a-proteobacteria)]